MSARCLILSYRRRGQFCIGDRGEPSLMPKAGWVLGMKPKADLMVGIPAEIRLIGKDNLRWVWFSNKAGDQTLIEFSAVDSSQSENVATRCFGRI